MSIDLLTFAEEEHYMKNLSYRYSIKALLAERGLTPRFYSRQETGPVMDLYMMFTSHWRRRHAKR